MGVTCLCVGPDSDIIQGEECRIQSTPRAIQKKNGVQEGKRDPQQTEERRLGVKTIPPLSQTIASEAVPPKQSYLTSMREIATINLCSSKTMGYQ